MQRLDVLEIRGTGGIVGVLDAFGGKVLRGWKYRQTPTTCG